MIDFPYKTRALRIEQPLGVYYVAVLPAELLLQVAYSDVMSATLRQDDQGYDLSGTQRPQQQKRLKEIAHYIGRSDAAFPNTIILAANFQMETGLIEDDEEPSDDSVNLANQQDPAVHDKRWSISEENNGCFSVTIPTREKLAAIIDGQHRLFAYTEVTDKAKLGMPLICSIFLDLPKPYQAQLFATINSTQKPVDKSLTYDLFGYNISDEPPEYWTPDKLAVFLTRKLGVDPQSPLKGRIIVAPQRDAGLKNLAKQDWRISTAVVVGGVVRLISTNPKRDTNILRNANDGLSLEKQPRSILIQAIRDKSPLRSSYTEINDNLIYTLVLNYLIACHDVFWTPAKDDSFILKTVGVQALFDILRKLAKQ
ncbi:MAG: DNA phosphorothioation-associated DGQHR protein 1, partial [Alkalinema sp. CACIAM 70d]